MKILRRQDRVNLRPKGLASVRPRKIAGQWTRFAAAVTAISDPNFALIVEPTPSNGHSAEHRLANLPETPDFSLVGAAMVGLLT